VSGIGKYRCVALLVLVALMLSTLLLVFLEGRPGITHADFERVKKGMTRDEVLTILGQPDWEFPYGGGINEPPVTGLGYNLRAHFWRRSHDELVVDIDLPDGKVCATYVLSHGPDERTLAQRIRDQLRMWQDGEKAGQRDGGTAGEE
jgi:hypothetical protein